MMTKLSFKNYQKVDHDHRALQLYLKDAYGCRLWLRRYFVFCLAITQLFILDSVWAANKTVNVTMGRSSVVDVPFPINTVKVGDQDVVAVKALSTTKLSVRGKRIGQTTLILSGRGQREFTVDVSVNVSTTDIQAAADQIAGAGKVHIKSNGHSVVLSGELSSARDVLDVMEAVKARYAGRDQQPLLVNRMYVKGRQQVQVRLKFVEVSRSGLRALGFNAFGEQNVLDGNGALRETTAGGLLNSGGSLVESSESGFYVPVDPNSFENQLAQNQSNVGGFGGISAAQRGLEIAPPLGAFRLILESSKFFPFVAALSVLSGRGLAKTLSEPTLVAMNGQKADFLVGGQFPVPVPEALNQISIEWKDYGIQMAVTPTIVEGNEVQLDLDAKVSDLDFSSGIVLQSVKVPGLTTRRAQTSVRLRDGQSFAVAGLVSDRMRNSVRKVPLLGDIPVLGMLFRSQESSREEVELVMVVSVELVGPQATSSFPKIPTEMMHNDPNDFQFFLLGWSDGRGKKQAQESSSKTGVDNRPSLQKQVGGSSGGASSQKKIGPGIARGPMGFER